MYCLFGYLSCSNGQNGCVIFFLPTAKFLKKAFTTFFFGKLAKLLIDTEAAGSQRTVIKKDVKKGL